VHTKEKLAQALDAAGLTAMAAKAREGHYHDFESPLAFPSMQLVHDLTNVEAWELRDRAINGDFDASDDEAADWADSLKGDDNA
jgi:hypothetical protein